MSIEGSFSLSCKIFDLTQIVRDLNLLGDIKTIFRFSPYQVVEV